ncbi:hypothetical protein ACFS4T_04850 [Pseudomonas lini]
MAAIDSPVAYLRALYRFALQLESSVSQLPDEKNQPNPIGKNVARISPICRLISKAPSLRNRCSESSMRFWTKKHSEGAADHR